MGESKEIIKNRIKSGELDHIPTPATPKKRNIFLRLATYPLEVIKILLGIDKDSLKKAINQNNGTHSVYDRPSIRDTYRVSPPPAPSHHHAPTPYTYNPVEYDNLRIYLQGQDGKGDHDCNCDHER